MLVRLAHALHRQEQDGDLGGQPLGNPPQIAFHDEGVDADRQMRPVLLDGGDRQDRDGFGQIGCGKILPGPFGPEFRRRHGGSPQSARPATASTSTTNAGRAKPATIIRVEAGAGESM